MGTLGIALKEEIVEVIIGNDHRCGTNNECNEDNDLVKLEQPENHIRKEGEQDDDIREKEPDYKSMKEDERADDGYLCKITFSVVLT